MNLEMKKIKSYVDTAIIWSKRSTCARKQVGAVIFNLRTDRLLAIGYNGTVKGQQHCNELFIAPDKINKRIWHYIDIPMQFYDIACTDDSQWLTVDKEVWKVIHHSFSDMYEVHAEQNAVFNLIKTGVSYDANDLAIVSTLEPCFNCAKAIVALGIKHVYFITKYDNASGDVIKYLKECGVKCECIDGV